MWSGSYHDSNDFRVDQDYTGTFDMWNRNFSSKRQAEEYKEAEERKQRQRKKYQQDKVRQEQYDKRRKRQAQQNQSSRPQPIHPQTSDQIPDKPHGNLSDLNKGLPNFKDCGQCCTTILVLILLPFFVAYYAFWYLVYLLAILITITIGIVEAVVIISTLGFCGRYSSVQNSYFRKAYCYFNLQIRGNWGLVFKIHVGCFSTALVIFIIVVIILAVKASNK